MEGPKIHPTSPSLSLEALGTGRDSSLHAQKCPSLHRLGALFPNPESRWSSTSIPSGAWFSMWAKMCWQDLALYARKCQLWFFVCGGRIDLWSLTGLEWSMGRGRVRLSKFLGWTEGMPRLPALGGAPQEAPPFAAVLLLKGMQGLHKAGCGPSPLATFEKTICQQFGLRCLPLMGCCDPECCSGSKAWSLGKKNFWCISEQWVSPETVPHPAHSSSGHFNSLIPPHTLLWEPEHQTQYFRCYSEDGQIS